MTTTNESAPLQRGAVVKLFSPIDTGSHQYNATCAQCGAVAQGKPLCYTCWRWKLSAQHTAAAAALLRGVR